MIFSDGECPLCEMQRLHLNESDLLECPNCNLLCSAADRFALAVLPKLGRGRFRFEDGRVCQPSGALIARSIEGGVLPDYDRAFRDVAELRQYREELVSSIGWVGTEKSLLRKFLDAFHDCVFRAELKTFWEMWPAPASRTRFYSDLIFPAVANMLHMRHCREKYTVDHALMQVDSDGREVPKIYIESENNYLSATHEIQKLCSLSSPVRVLVTATTKEFIPQPSAGAFAQLREWQAILKSHHSVNGGSGKLAVIIGRMKDASVRFDVCAFHSDGSLAIPMRMFLERSQIGESSGAPGSLR